MLTFKQRLYHGPTLVGDAAKKPRLLAYVSQRLDVNQLNITSPEAVLRVHRSDVEAGADVIMTNTWDAAHLVQSIGGDQVFALSKRGVEIAREAAQRKAYVVPVMGPVAYNRDQFLGIGQETARSCYRIPLEAFAKAGLDGLVLETFTWGPDLVLAYKTAREILGEEIPIIALVGMVSNGSTPSMTGMRQIIRYYQTLKNLGADSIGVGCTFYEDARKAQARFSGEIDPPFTISVNISREIWRNEQLTTVTPEILAQVVPEYERNGATFVFSCCGGNPEYIGALKASVNPLPRELPKARPVPELTYQRVQSRFEQALTAGEKVLCIEPRAPQQVVYRGDEPSYRIFDALLAAGHRFFVNLTDLAGGVPGVNPIVWASDIENEPRFKACNLETIVHIACSEATPDRHEQDMRTALRKGLKNIFVLGGETAYGSGTSEYASSVLEVLANRTRAKFFTGVSLDMSADDEYFQSQLRLLREKVDLCLGKQDILIDPNNQTIVPVFTQAVYDPQTFERRYQTVKEMFGDQVKIIVGVYPLLSHAEAERAIKRLGMKIPEHVLERYIGRTPEEQRQIGIQIAREIIESARRADGIYLVQPSETPPNITEKAAKTMLEILAT